MVGSLIDLHPNRENTGAAATSDRPEMARRLGLAQRIVTELRGALDHALGGEIAGNLAAIYDYVFHEILSMQVDQDSVHAANCRQVLLPLLEAWNAIPPGTADRELRGRDLPGTEPADTRPGSPVAEEAPGERLVSLSA